MLREHKWFRLLLWISGGFVAGFGLILISVYFVLKSPEVQRKIVASLKEPLAKEGVNLELSSLSIDLFAGVNLEGLKLRFARPKEIEGDLAMESLRLRYAFWPLLSKRLEVREAKLSGVRGDLSLYLPPPAPEPPADPEALTRVLELLRNPPATVRLPEFATEDVKIKLHVYQDPMALAVDLDNMTILSSLSLEKGLLQAKFKADLTAQANFMKGPLAGITGLSVKPEFAFKAALEGDNLAWSLDLNGLDLLVKNASVSQANAIEAAVAELPLNLEMKLEHEGKVPNSGVKVIDLGLPISANGGLKVTGKKISFQDLKSKQSAKLALNQELSFDISLPKDLAKAQLAAWDLEQRLTLETLDLKAAGKPLVNLSNLQLEMAGKGEEGKGELKLKLDSNPMQVAGLSGDLKLKKTTDLKLDLPERQLALVTELFLNDQKALNLELNAKDKDQKLSGDFKLKAKTYPAWTSLHKGVSELEKLAWPMLDLKSEFEVLHEEALEDIKDPNKLTITTKLEAALEQTQGKDQALANFRALLIKLNAKLLNKDARGSLQLVADNLVHKALKKPLNLDQRLNFQVNFLDWLTAKLDGETKLDSAKRLAFKIALKEKPSELSYEDEIEAFVDPGLMAYLDGLDILKDLGSLSLKSVDEANLRFNEARIKDVKSWEPRNIKATAKLVQTLNQEPHQGKYQLGEALVIATGVRVENNNLASDTKVSVPSIEAKEQAKLKGMFVRANLNVEDLKEQKRVTIVTHGKADAVMPLMAAADKVKDAIRNIKFGLRGEILEKDRFTLQDVHAEVDQKLLSFQGKGDLALKTGRGGFQGLVKSVLPEGRDIAGLKGQGAFELPFTVTMYDKKVLALHSEPSFEKLSFTYGDDIQVKGMDGKLSLDEELSIDDAGRIGFLYLNTQNPFTRVDFENIDPYLGQRLGLKIEKLRFKHIEAGPILTNLELRQNLILLNEMKANLLNGSALGRVFVDLHPERLQLGFLGRFSNLQLELLKEVAKRKNRKDILSGRAAANFDIRKRLATGRIDVTSIGQNQLLSMIDVLDPDYKDTQMMAARRALQVSYPSFVSIGMEQGLMDLTIGLSGAVGTDINVRSIPLTAFINANAGETLMSLEKFLQTGGQ